MSAQAPPLILWLPRKTGMNSRGLGLSGCRLYRRVEKSNCDPPRVFLRLPTTTLRTTLIRRSAQGIGIDFRRAMFLINLMRTRLSRLRPKQYAESCARSTAARFADRSAFAWMAHVV